MLILLVSYLGKIMKSFSTLPLVAGFKVRTVLEEYLQYHQKLILDTLVSL